MLVDMDHFYAACEEIRRPELKGKPVVVGWDPKEGSGRGVVMTCNYEARKYGIRSGMAISKAYKLKPDAIYLPVDFDYYEEKSREVMAILRSKAEDVEQVSIDEAFLDLSGKLHGYEDSLRYAVELKKEIAAKALLPCSIGIGPNKLIAKMACEEAKPDGIRQVRQEEARDFIKNMPVGNLYGVGRKIGEQLEQIGYRTIGDLAEANIMDLMDRFGSYGIELHNYANAIDESSVHENSEIKSIGRERTFGADTLDEKEIGNAILELSREVIGEVSKAGAVFKTVTLKLRYHDFTEHLKSRSIKPTGSLESLVQNAMQLYRQNPEKAKRIRKIGVRVSGLSDYKKQKKLF